MVMDLTEALFGKMKFLDPIIEEIVASRRETLDRCGPQSAR